MSISEIAGQSHHIKAPNRINLKYVGHVYYKMFIECCQLSGLNSLAYRLSNFLKRCDSQSWVCQRKSSQGMEALISKSGLLAGQGDSVINPYMTQTMWNRM